MNALLLEQQKRLEKIAVNSFYFSLALAIFSGQGLFFNNSLLASEADVIKMAYLTPDVQIEKVQIKSQEQINYLAEKTKWEAYIKKKYRNAKVMAVEPGIMHVKLTKYINSQPIRINVVEINRKINPNIELAPTLASEHLAKKATIRTIAQKNNSIVAVNGTFFKPQTGVPLGTLMIDRKMLTGPIYNRVAMGISKTDFKMARLEMRGSIKTNNYTVNLDNINQPRMLATYVIAYTRDWGQLSPPPPKYGVQIAVENNKIIKISNGSIEIPKDGYVISGPIQKLEPFFNAISVEVNINTEPNWQDVNHIISGGPYLVKDSQVYVDINEQKLKSIGGKNPRTAIGYTKDNDLILVTIDGREESSVGMTIYDLAKFMKSIDCYNAMNLDGGGSSVMYVKGNIVNHPSIKGGAAISNAFTVSIPSRISYKDEGSK